MNTIYLFNNTWKPSQERHDWNVGYAMTVDGHVLASHCSSSNEFLKHDLGFQHSDWKHEEYDKHHGPGNWQLEWVDDVKGHAGLQAAFKLNQELAAAEGVKEGESAR